MKDIDSNPEAVVNTRGDVEGQDKPFYPVAAAIVAAGVGVLVLGILTTLGEASEGIKTFLEFNAGVGSLSGKTILAVLAWVISWPILNAVYRRKEPSVRTVAWTAGILVGVGFLLTFPTFFQLFAPEA